MMNACLFWETAEMTTVICENDDKCKSLLNDIPSCVRQLIHIKPVSKETSEIAQRKNIRLVSFDEVERLGAEKKNRPVVSLSFHLWAGRPDQ